MIRSASMMRSFSISTLGNKLIEVFALNGVGTGSEGMSFAEAVAR